MDIAAFLAEFEQATAEAGYFERVLLDVIEDVARGRGFLRAGMFLSFYFNGRTQTLAFALIEGNERLWGIDRDNFVGWHRHPLGATERHDPISPMSVSEIVQELTEVVNTLL